MSAGWEPLPWDSAFFGLPTARLHAAQPSPEQWQGALAGCRGWGARVVYALLEADDRAATRLAERSGFELVDLRVTLEWRAGPTEPAAQVRPFHQGDLATLAAVARASYGQSRFYADGRYPRERCDALYEAWLARECADPAAAVLVAERDGEAAGFITCRYAPEPRRGEIGLLGVAAAARGGGLGGQLVRAAQGWFAAHGAHSALVVTQGRNLAAQRLYQRCGFLTSRVQLWYHGWL